MSGGSSRSTQGAAGMQTNQTHLRLKSVKSVDLLFEAAPPPVTMPAGWMQGAKSKISPMPHVRHNADPRWHQSDPTRCRAAGRSEPPAYVLTDVLQCGSRRKREESPWCTHCSLRAAAQPLPALAQCCQVRHGFLARASSHCSTTAWQHRALFRLSCHMFQGSLGRCTSFCRAGSSPQSTR